MNTTEWELVISPYGDLSLKHNNLTRWNSAEDEDWSEEYFEEGDDMREVIAFLRANEILPARIAPQVTIEYLPGEDEMGEIFEADAAGEFDDDDDDEEDEGEEDEE